MLDADGAVLMGSALAPLSSIAETLPEFMTYRPRIHGSRCVITRLFGRVNADAGNFSEIDELDA